MFKRGKVFNVVISILIALSFGNTAHGAEVYFSRASGVSDSIVGVGDIILLDILIDTMGESINAVEMEIAFSDNAFEVKDISHANSAIGLWISEPSVKGNTLTLAGILPGGYSGDKLYLGSVEIRVVDYGKGYLNFNRVRILKNDGLGTDLKVYTSNIEFEVVEGVGAVVVDDYIYDKEAAPPILGNPRIGRSEEIFSGDYFVVFSAKDKDSEINDYFIKEARLKLIGLISPWKKAESPHVLEDQKLKSFIFIKVTDPEGGSHRVIVTPQNDTKEDFESVAIALGIILGAIIIIAVLTRFKTKNF